MLPHWGLCYWVGVNEKVQNTGILCPIFLRCGLYCFLALIFFFQILSPPPPPPPLSLSQGLCCFSEHWADSDVHCNCCAPSPHMGTLSKIQEDDKKMQNNSQEQCIWVPGEGYSHFFFIRRLGPSFYHSPQNKYQEFQAPQKILEILATQKISPILYVDLKKDPKMHRNDP